MLHAILENWQPFVALAGFAFFWLWESWKPFFAPHNRIRHAVRNVAIALVNAFLLVVILSGVTVAVAEVVAFRRVGILYVAPLPSAVHFVAAFVLFDLWVYLWHRANHRIHFLWRFHRMHHSDPDMDVSTATRFHPGEIVMASLLRLGLVPLIGIPIAVLVLYDLSQLAITQFHHANLALPARLDRWVRYVIVSPNMHKVHHSRVRVETDSNYSSLLSVWDRLFGSYREKPDYAKIRYGLDEFTSDEGQSLRGLIMTPLRAR
jgi:sterol desaturase/sphingolipid hydroxylase (fatty acid hydroxylase superfamily)